MAKLLDLKCPECHGTFEWLRHPSDEPLPDTCELCGKYMGDGPEKVPVLKLSYGSEKNRIPDQVYRRMEQGSQERAEDAAEITGASVSEMSAIKMTNMKDNTRAGESSVLNNAHEAEKRLSTAAARPVMQNPQAAQWAGETQSGPDALHTRKVMDKMPHANLIAQATRNGSDGKRY